jgi:hypothetical protein
VGYIPYEEVLETIELLVMTFAHCYTVFDFNSHSRVCVDEGRAVFHNADGITIFYNIQSRRCIRTS